MKDKLILQLKKLLYYNFNFFNLRERKAIEAVASITNKTKEVYSNSPVVIGITKERWHLHSHYIKACQELKVSYVIIDFFSKNWFEQLKDANIDFLIGRPSVQYSPWKDMFDNRLRLLSSLNLCSIYPNETGLWIWENKLRTLEWLKLNDVPHPESYVFYNAEEAQAFSKECNYPIVYKSSSGSGASGVKILKKASDFKSIIHTAFNKGLRTYRKHKLDKEHGFAIFQSFLDDVAEWRIIRIGEYYFGYQKIKEGEFHSGSQNFGYGMPPKACLDLVKEITDKHELYYVDIDVFETKDKRYLVNEVQPYFGQKDDRELLRVDGKTGRLTNNKNEWVFEEGVFCKNNLCNLRITEMIKMYTK